LNGDVDVTTRVVVIRELIATAAETRMGKVKPAWRDFARFVRESIDALPPVQLMASFTELDVTEMVERYMTIDLSCTDLVAPLRFAHLIEGERKYREFLDLLVLDIALFATFYWTEGFYPGDLLPAASDTERS